MIFLVGAACVVAMAWAAALLFGKRFELTLAPVIFGLILLLYLLGFAGLLGASGVLLLALGVAAFAFCVFRCIKTGPVALRALATPGLLCFAVFMVFVMYTTMGRHISTPDEYSHWAIIVKNMLNLGNFGNTQLSTAFFTSYPPAIPLFQTMFSTLRGAFVEADLFRASDLFFIALLLPLFRNISWKHWRWIPATAFIAVLLPTAFNVAFLYTALYVDAFLGLLFAYILYLHFSGDTTRWVNWLCVGGAAFVLTLTKPSGIAFAAIALALVAADTLLAERKKAPGQWAALLKRLALPVLLAAAAWLSWRLYLGAAGVDAAWQNSTGNSISLGALLGLLTGNAQDYQREAFSAFIHFFVRSETISGSFILMSNLTWVAAVAVLGVWVRHLAPDAHLKRRIALCTGGLVAGFFIYQTGLLLMYLFSFKPHEATGVASMPRYSQTYILGAVLFLVYMALTLLRRHNQAKYTLASGVVCFAMLFFVPMESVVDAFVYPQPHNAETAKSAKDYAYIEAFADFMDPETDRVYLIAQNHREYPFWYVRYYATPIRLSPMYTWSLGEPYYPEDVWTVDLDPDAWAEQLREEYTYVFVWSIDQAFVDRYGQFFEEGDPYNNRCLYRVEKDGEEIRLVLYRQY